MRETPAGRQTHRGTLLPRRAEQGAGWAARQVLLDALVVANLSGNWDGGGLCPWGHHGRLPLGGLRLPKEGQQRQEAVNPNCIPAQQQS